ncbi:MAG: site-2 protease family protein, partial [Ktedonobacteraceae bacterium]|nr:site-2 protease family protein [Ktedonobacteraceae bacterium]
ADAGSEQREAAEKGSAEGGKKRRGWLGIGGLLAALGAWLLKIPSLGFLLKFGAAGISAFASAFLYSLVFGWPFAIGLIISLFIHEMGHALVMKLKGIPVGGLIFIPMLGAAVTMQQMPKNARDEAEVGIAGPIAGALAASFCLWMAYQPDASPIWASLAYFGFFINLFNLVPILPFDGGRVLAAIDRRIWILGFLLLLGVQIWEWIHGNPSFWLLLFVLMAGMQLWSRGFSPNTPEMREYYNVPISTRVIMSLLYFGLAGALFLGMSITHGMLPL